VAVEEANLSSIVNDSGERSHSQDGSPSATQNIHHKMADSILTENVQNRAVYLLLKTFVTR